MLLNAKQILVSELTLAGNQSKDDIENLVDDTINVSFAEYSKIALESGGTPPETEEGNVVKKFIPFDTE